MNRTLKEVARDRFTGKRFNTVKDNADRALFLTSLDFRYRNSFYLKKSDILTGFENLIDANITNEDYIYALAWYTGTVLGLRLAPTILVSRLFAKNITIDYTKLKVVVDNVFTRPDFIANSLNYIKGASDLNSIGKVPYGYRLLLRNKLSTFSELTLKKSKLKRREVKLADLIKLLRPYPKNDKMSKLYKDIIENNKGASLVVEKDVAGNITKADHITAVLSDTSVTTDQKLDFIEDNVRNIPINALISNLSNVRVTESNMDIITTRINGIFNDEKALRFLNPFDLIMIRASASARRSYYERIKLELVNTNSYFIDKIDDILMKHLVNTINIKAKHPLILFDVSGSMEFNDGAPAVAGIKILSFLLPIIGRFTNDITYVDFGVNIYDRTDSMKWLLKQRPHEVAKALCAHYKSFNEGTRLLDCTRMAVNKFNDRIDSVIIISDEMTWADSKRALEGFRNVIPNRLHDKSFLFNVNYAQTKGETAIEPSVNISRVSGLDAKILYLMEAMFDFKSFKAKMIKKFNSITG